MLILSRKSGESLHLRAPDGTLIGSIVISRMSPTTVRIGLQGFDRLQIIRSEIDSLGDQAHGKTASPAA